MTQAMQNSAGIATALSRKGRGTARVRSADAGSVHGSAGAGAAVASAPPSTSNAPVGLYSPEERKRRDETPWTLVQGILAPLQFLIFLVSLVLVLRYFSTGEGALAADISIVAKTLALYVIMVTGAIWEKVVFGKYLFAGPFFWEDAFSMLVIALHTAYLVMLLLSLGSVAERMAVALSAYAAYVINAVQFVLKLRAARLQGSQPTAATA